jgi:phage major head subunit gpT-like protein
MLKALIARLKKEGKLELAAMLEAKPELAAEIAEQLGIQLETDGEESKDEGEVEAGADEEPEAESLDARLAEILADSAFAKRPKFARKCALEGMDLVEAKAALADKLLAEQGKTTTINALKAKARHRGLGFSGKERDNSANGATGAAEDESRFKGMPIAERAKIELVEKPPVAQVFGMLASALPGYDAERLYAKTLHLDAKRRPDGRPYMNRRATLAFAESLRELADPRFGPLVFVGEDGERLGSWGKAGPDYSLVTVKGFQGSFYAALEDELDSEWAGKLAFKSESDQETETHRFLGFFPQMREWIGNRQEKGLPPYEFTLTNKLYEATVPVDKNDLRFQKFGLINMRFGEAGARAAQHWASLLSAVIIANPLCYDGQNFFDTDHTLGGDSGTMTNDLSVTDYSVLNVGDAEAPTVDEFVDILIYATPHLRLFKDNQGEPINGGMRRVIVMVPSNMEGVALAAVASERLGSGADNPTKAGQKVTWDVVVNQRLTTMTQLYIFRADSRNKPFITQEPGPIEMSWQGAGSPDEFYKHRYVMGLESTRAAGVGAWECALRLTLS